MSMLSEQVNKIRKVAKCVYLATDKEVADDIASTLNQAADTIEALSVKLAAANMEQSDRYYGGGWVACEDRLPEFGKRYLVTALWRDEGFTKYSVYDAVYGSNGLWHTHNYNPVSYKVLAWKSLPEPYRPNAQNKMNSE